MLITSEVLQNKVIYTPIICNLIVLCSSMEDILSK